MQKFLQLVIQQIAENSVHKILQNTENSEAEKSAEYSNSAPKNLQNAEKSEAENYAECCNSAAENSAENRKFCTRKFCTVQQILHQKSLQIVAENSAEC